MLPRQQQQGSLMPFSTPTEEKGETTALIIPGSRFTIVPADEPFPQEEEGPSSSPQQEGNLLRAIAEQHPDTHKLLRKSLDIFQDTALIPIERLALVEQRLRDIKVALFNRLYELGYILHYIQELNLRDYEEAGHTSLKDWAGQIIPWKFCQFAMNYYEIHPFMMNLGISVEEIKQQVLTETKTNHLKGEVKRLNTNFVVAAREIAQIERQIPRAPSPEVRVQLEEQLEQKNDAFVAKQEEARARIQAIMDIPDTVLIAESRVMAGAPAKIGISIFAEDEQRDGMKINGSFDGRIHIEQLSPSVVEFLGRPPCEISWIFTVGGEPLHKTGAIEHVRSMGNLCPDPNDL